MWQIYVFWKLQSRVSASNKVCHKLVDSENFTQSEIRKPFPFKLNGIWSRENCHHNHIPFNLKGNGFLFFFLYDWLMQWDRCSIFMLLKCCITHIHDVCIYLMSAIVFRFIFNYFSYKKKERKLNWETNQTIYLQMCSHKKIIKIFTTITNTSS